jgi:hypothetical protein
VGHSIPRCISFLSFIRQVYYSHPTISKVKKTWIYPAWEFAAESHLLKLQRLQNKVPRTIGNFPMPTSVRDMNVAFQIPYVYDYITNSCRQQAEVIQNHENENVRNLAAVMCTTVQVPKTAVVD